MAARQATFDTVKLQVSGHDPEFDMARGTGLDVDAPKALQDPLWQCMGGPPGVVRAMRGNHVQ